MKHILMPIGHVRNGLRDPAPPEEIMKRDSVIEILPEYEDGLLHIEDSEYIKIVFILDRSNEAPMQLVTKSGRLTGVFASRSPRRPNKLGITVARLMKIDGCKLHVAGLDALDGTPVVDLKPFSPLFDAPGMDGPYFDIVHRSDEKEVEGLCSQVWNGWDYIPEIFDDWILDGGFHCLRYKGRIVALGKYTRRKKDIIWLEGLRVHPSHKGKGYARLIATKIQHFLEIREWKKLRFMTAEIGLEAKHMALEDGFQVVGIFHYLNMESEEGIREIAPEGLDVLSLENNNGGNMSLSRENDNEAIVSFVLSSQEYQDNMKQYFRSWSAWDMDEDLIRDEVSAGRCFSVRDAGVIIALAFYTHYKPYNSLSISFIAGSEDGKRVLLRYAAEVFHRNNLSVVEIKTASESTVKAANSEGFSHGHAGMALIFEKERAAGQD